MILIKRYPNRKLYNTEAKQYITLEGVAALIRQGAEIRVIDHSSGEDLTVLTLTQIILEQERKQSGLLTNAFLTSLIRAGEDRLYALPHNLSRPLPRRRPVDEEIQQRVQWLVQQGELSHREGQRLLEKLLHPGAPRAFPLGHLPSEEEIERHLRQRPLPTQEDLVQLHRQLEALSQEVAELTVTLRGSAEVT